MSEDVKKETESQPNEGEEPVDDSLEAWKNWFGNVAKSTLDQTKSTLDSVRRDFTELGESVANQNVVSKAGELGKATFDVLKKQAHAVSNLVSVEAEDLHEEPISAAKYSENSKSEPNIPVLSQPDSGNTDEILRESSEKPAVPKSKSTNSGVWSLFGGEDKEAKDQTGSSWWNSLTEKASKLMQDIDESVAENVKEQESENQQSASNEKDWLDSLSNTVSKAFYVQDTTKEEVDETLPIAISKSGKQITLPRHRLFALQNDAATYLDEPTGAPELFDDWLDNFEIHDFGEAIEDLLAKQPHIRSIYTKLVPDQISSETFWAHYFYRLHQLELDEATKNMIRSAVDTEIGHSKGQVPSIGTQSPLSDQWSVCSSEVHDAVKDEDKRDNKTPTKEETNDWETGKFSDSE